MARTELPWMVAGRLVRPYALAVSLAALFQGLLIMTGSTTYGTSEWASIIAFSAFASTALLWVGWWAESTDLMQHGLLLSAGCFAARAAYVLLDSQAWMAAGFLACWSIASGGAFLLEATTGHKRWPRDGGGSE